MNNIKNKVVILMYHAIEVVRNDPWEIFVSPEKFESQIKTLKEYFHIISLNEFLQKKKQDNGLSVVITFDDGYANNLYNAKPVLEKYGVPATFFITIQNLGKDREYWWDQLENIFCSESELPGELNLDINNEILKIVFYKNSKGEVTNTERFGALNKIRKKLMPLDVRQKDRIINELSIWSDINYECRTTHRVLDFNELKKLADSEQVDIGCHTYSHPVLSSLDLQSQEYEIAHAKQILQKIINKPVLNFSYPFGKDKHYNDLTIQVLKKYGFSSACTSVEALACSDTDRFLLPRVFVRDSSGSQLQKSIINYIN